MTAALPSAVLYTSFADPKQGFPGYCAATPPDWNGEKAAAWPGRHRQVYAPFREGKLRPESLGADRGRGLISGADVKKGGAICSLQPPLALHQYEDSRRAVEVCSHCGRFVGSLRSGLSRPLTSIDGDAPETLVDDPAELDELEVGEFNLSPVLACEHRCGAVFCGQECAELARTQGWHRVFCTDMLPEKRPLWQRFQKHAVRHHQPLVLAAQVMAEIICLVKHFGVDLWEAMAYFTRFAKMSWLNSVNLPSRSCTQVLPSRGRLAEMAFLRRGKRYEVLTYSLDMLVTLLWERQFAELLTLDFYANLVGQFSLSNIWVSLEHPLSEVLTSRAKDPEFRRRFGRLVKASHSAASELMEDDYEAPTSSSKEKDKKAPERETASTNGEPNQVVKEEHLESCWMLPRFEGTGLYVCIALANHSCTPTFTMAYEDGGIATMRALRDISAGEELTLAYVSPFYDLNERLVHLWRTWGFVCTCRKCQDQLMRLVMERGGADNKTAAIDGLTEAGLNAADDVAAAKLFNPECRSPAGGVSLTLEAAADTGSALGGPVEEEQADRSCTGGTGDKSNATTIGFSPPGRSCVARSQAKTDGVVDSEESGSAEESSDEEEEEEDDESDSSEDFEGRALAGKVQVGGPAGLRGPPASVLALEADLKRMMELMAEDDEEDADA